MLLDVAWDRRRRCGRRLGLRGLERQLERPTGRREAGGALWQEPLARREEHEHRQGRQHACRGIARSSCTVSVRPDINPAS